MPFWKLPSAMRCAVLCRGGGGEEALFTHTCWTSKSGTTARYSTTTSSTTLRPLCSA